MKDEEKTCDNCFWEGTSECNHCIRDKYRDQDNWSEMPRGSEEQK